MPRRLPSWPVHSFHYWALLAMVRPRGHIGPFLRLESEPRARMIAEDKENPCPTWHQQNSRAAQRRRRRPAGGLRATGQSSQTAFFMRWQKNMRKAPGQGMQARSTMASPIQMPKEPHQQAEASAASIQKGAGTNLFCPCAICCAPIRLPRRLRRPLRGRRAQQARSPLPPCGRDT